MEKENSKIKVSIIMPVYNVSDYIERCIESVISQSYPYIECIIVDDATQDDSIVKCEKMVRDYKGSVQFRILHHEHNRGLPAARNTGTEAATGQYVYYLDSDDTISSDCIEKLLAPILSDPTIEMVQGWFRVKTGEHFEQPKLIMQEPVDLNGKEKIRTSFFNRSKWIKLFAWNKLIKADFLRANHIRFEEGRKWEDILWLYYVIKYLNHLYLIPDYTYCYYRRPGSISSTTKISEFIHEMGLIYKEMAEHFSPELKGREAKYHYKAFLINFARNPEYKQLLPAVGHFRKALFDGRYYKELTVFTLTAFFLGLKPFRALSRIVDKVLKR